MKHSLLVSIAIFTGFALNASGASWTLIMPMPISDQEHVLVYANGFLYNIGGVDGTNRAVGTNVYYSPVFTNGTLGSWKQTASLPEAVADAAGITDSGYIYIIAGNHFNTNLGEFPTNIVYYTQIKPDGSLANWQTTSPLPQSVFWLRAAVWNHTIYTTGGQSSYNTNGQGRFASPSAISNVYSATIQSDGSLSAWNSQTPIPEIIESHMAVANSALYVIGGVSESNEVSTVLYANINHDGSLGNWIQTTPLPTNLMNHGGVAADGRIYCFEGWSTTTNGEHLEVPGYSAAVLGGGVLGNWSAETRVPNVYEYSGFTYGENFIFVSGGFGGGTYNGVYVMPLPELPNSPNLKILESVTNGSRQLQLISATNTGFGIQASTDLSNWSKIGWGVTDTNGKLLFQDTNSLQYSNRFYRSYWPLP